MVKSGFEVISGHQPYEDIQRNEQVLLKKFQGHFSLMNAGSSLTIAGKRIQSKDQT